MERAGRKKTLETRDRILDAAEDVFNECGYSNTTLNEIAEAAGLTKESMNSSSRAYSGVPIELVFSR